MHLSHARPLNPAALAYLPFVVVLIRVRVRGVRDNPTRNPDHQKPLNGVLLLVIFQIQLLIAGSILLSGRTNVTRMGSIFKSE